ncbi:MAG: phosphoribosyltransferase family protein [Flavobacterium sp.]|jgi:pyrimidine operon attenuation protein/uracil phosphoribosyltransferase
MQQIILSHQDIVHKIKRISFQILETFFHEEELFIAGISGNGYAFAKEIEAVVNKNSLLKTHLIELKIDKKNLHNSITCDLNRDVYKDKCIVLVDDVLHTGTTLIYGVKYFLDTPLKKMKTAILVNRNHKNFPIKADFKGISLSTSLQNHIEVIYENNNWNAVIY